MALGYGELSSAGTVVQCCHILPLVTGCESAVLVNVPGSRRHGFRVQFDLVAPGTVVQSAVELL